MSFVDTTFPKDLQLPDVSELYEKDHLPPLGNVTWKRPGELVDNPIFEDTDGGSRFDVNQHKLGDCWFLSSAAILADANHHDLFKAVVPDNQSFDPAKGYTGKFSFKFWQVDGWHTVEIDDRLPKEDGTRGLLFCYNETNPSEFWPALLEKAYAKLNGGYANINSNIPQNALVDMTGGVGHLTMINAESRSSDLYQRILRQEHLGALMVIGTPQPSSGREPIGPTGIVGGHAYSVTKVQEISDNNGTTHQLIRLRNPWGKQEWNDAWSRGSSEWENVSEEIRNQYNEDIEGDENGEFWMPFAEVLNYFFTLSTCFLPLQPSTAPLAGPRRALNTLQFHESWVPTAGAIDVSSEEYWNRAKVIAINIPVSLRSGSDPGATIDPFYEKGTLVVSLMRSTIQSADVNMAFDIYQWTSKESLKKLTPSNYNTFVSLVDQVKSLGDDIREISEAYLNADHGTFVIVPRFTQQCDYLLRVLSASELTIVTSDAN